MRFCTNCGSVLEEDAKFCTNCGTAVETPNDASISDTSTTEQPTQTMSAQTVPTQPNWGTSTQPAVQPAAGAPKPKGKPNIPVIVAAAVLVLVLLGVGIAYGVLGSGNKGAASPATTSSAASPKSTSPSSASASAKAGITLNADKLQSIVSGYSETEAAVSVIPVGENDEFDSRQANTKFVAAGLYLPVYLAAKDSGNSGAVSSAETMMRTMDNDSGNAAISDIGGLSTLNGWLGGAGYSNTDFQRAFGDVEASNSGYENYTSAADAAKMLAATDNAGGTNLLSYDLASEGVTTPSGVTLNGHRGQGIKNSYNFFILMKTGKTTMAVSVLTQNLGKDTAVSLINDILAEVASEVK